MSDQRTNPAMVETADGHHAILVDPAHQNHGWVFYRGPDPGQWVTLREATPIELSMAEATKKQRESLPTLTMLKVRLLRLNSTDLFGEVPVWGDHVCYPDIIIDNGQSWVFSHCSTVEPDRGVYREATVSHDYEARS